IREPWDRLARAMEAEFGIFVYARELAHMDSLDVVDGVMLSRTFADFVEDGEPRKGRPDPVWTTDSLTRLLEWNDRMGHPHLSMCISIVRAWSLGGDDFRTSVWDAIQRARRCGHMEMTAQLLGVRPWNYPNSAADSVQHFLAEGLAVAVEHHLVDQI